MTTTKPTARRARRARRASFSDELKDAIDRSGMTPHALAVRAGVSPAMLSRFMTGVRPGLTTTTVDRLAEALGLHLVGAAAKPGPRRAAPKRPARPAPPAQEESGDA